MLVILTLREPLRISAVSPNRAAGSEKPPRPRLVCGDMPSGHTLGNRAAFMGLQAQAHFLAQVVGCWAGGIPCEFIQLIHIKMDYPKKPVVNFSSTSVY